MIVVSGTLTIDPTKIDRARELLAELVPATLAEAGCNQYGYWISIDDPAVLRVFEEWEDEDALNAHMASPHMAAFLGSVGDLGITAVDIPRYDGATKSKLM